MSDTPWPVWAGVTVLVAAIGAYATLKSSEKTQVGPSSESASSSSVQPYVPPPPPPSNTFDPVSGTYRGKLYYLILVAGSNRSFAQNITLTINPPSGGSFRGTLIDDAQKTLPVQGQFGGNSITFQAVSANSSGGRMEITFQGVLTGGGSMRGSFRAGGNLWQQMVNQIRAENGDFVDVVPSSFELQQ